MPGSLCARRACKAVLPRVALPRSPCQVRPAQRDHAGPCRSRLAKATLPCACGLSRATLSRFDQSRPPCQGRLVQGNLAGRPCQCRPTKVTVPRSPFAMRPCKDTLSRSFFQGRSAKVALRKATLQGDFVMNKVALPRLPCQRDIRVARPRSPCQGRLGQGGIVKVALPRSPCARRPCKATLS